MTAARFKCGFHGSSTHWHYAPRPHGRFKKQTFAWLWGRGGRDTLKLTYFLMIGGQVIIEQVNHRRKTGDGTERGEGWVESEIFFLLELLLNNCTAVCISVRAAARLHTRSAAQGERLAWNMRNSNNVLCRLVHILHGQTVGTRKRARVL